MFRVIDLPSEVDLSKAKATFNDGTLEVMMPKAAPAKSLRVETKPGVSSEVILLLMKRAQLKPQAAHRLLLDPTSRSIGKAQAASSRR